MALLLTVRVPLARFPDLNSVLVTLRAVVGGTLRVDDDTREASRAGRARSSWCPWPRTSVAFYVPGATTRGSEAQLSRHGGAVEVRVQQPVLATWTDWRITVELATHLANLADAPVEVDGAEPLTPADVRRRFLDDDSRWRAECRGGAEAVQRTVQEGRVVRLGGPAGFAALGPRSWARLSEPDADEPSPAEVLDLIQRSVEARGFETYYPANLLCLDGRSGREVIASLLAPDVPTLLRDPEYILVGDDLEGGDGPTLSLLRFEDLDDALPRRVVWVDDRTCAIAPIVRADWPSLLDHMRPWLTPVADLLDDPQEPTGSSIEDWREFLPDPSVSRRAPAARPDSTATAAPPPGAPNRPWWKFW